MFDFPFPNSVVRLQPFNARVARLLTIDCSGVFIHEDDPSLLVNNY